MRLLDFFGVWRKVRVCVYTAAIDNYDVLQCHRFAGKAKMFCITDSPDLSPPEFTVHRAPRMFDNPTRDARFYKILPHRFLLPRLAPECDISIWMDANFQFDTERDIGEWAIERLQGSSFGTPTF